MRREGLPTAMSACHTGSLAGSVAEFSRIHQGGSAPPHGASRRRALPLRGPPGAATPVVVQQNRRAEARRIHRLIANRLVRWPFDPACHGHERQPHVQSVRKKAGVGFTDPFSLHSQD